MITATQLRRLGAGWFVLLALIYLSVPAWGLDKTCLTGTDPSVAPDAPQLAALEADIAAACPCASFDGSAGKGRRDYLRCVSPRIKEAVKSGALRSKCKARVAKAHKLSTCGAADSDGIAPCLAKKANGKISCRVATAAKCQSDARNTRVLCTGYTRCIDAGDNNGDMLVAAPDSGICIVAPTATFTATNAPTSTDTPIATFTPTETPTDTNTATHTNTPTPTNTPLPTEPPNFGWTFCANLDATCTLPGNREVRFGVGDVSVSKFISATTVPCTYAAFDADPQLPFEGEPQCDYFLAEDTRTPTITRTATATTKPTSTATPEDGWVFCANEGGSCTMPSAYRLVRFGVPGHYFVEVGDSTLIDCSLAAFGTDPAFGQPKHCEYSSSDEVLPTFTPTFTATATPTSTATATPTPTANEEAWTFCAAGNDLGPSVCSPPPNRKVRFGVPGKYLYRMISDSIICTTRVWGDPAPGEAKNCEYSSYTYPNPTPVPPSWTFCAHPREICLLPAHDQVVSLGIPQSGGDLGNLIVQVPGTSIECSASVMFPESFGIPPADCYYLTSATRYDGNPLGVLVTNRNGDASDVRVLPDLLPEPFYTCVVGTGGPCKLTHPLSAEPPQEIALLVIDPRLTDADDRNRLSYHWVIEPPPNTGLPYATYASQGITGYFEPVLKIGSQAMPNLDNMSDRYWRITVTVTREPHTDYPMSIAPFISVYGLSMLYVDSAIDLPLGTKCQLREVADSQCPIESLLRPPWGTY